jgi:hypothetical protein
VSLTASLGGGSVQLQALKPYRDVRPKLVAKIKKADPSLSLRRIAKLLGVSHQTVANALSNDSTPEAEKANETNTALSNDSTPDPNEGVKAGALVARADKKAAAAERVKAKREASRRQHRRHRLPHGADPLRRRRSAS